MKRSTRERRSHVSRFLLASVFASAAVVPSGVMAAESLVEPIETRAHELAIGKSPISIALRRHQGIVISSVHVSQVATGGVIRMSDADLITAALEADTLTLSAKPESLESGAYEVTVQLLGSNGATQDLLVHVTLPNAQLRPVPTVVLTRRLGVFYDDEWDGDHEMRLLETGGRTALTGLVIEQLDNASADGRPVGARLEAVDAGSEVPSNGSVRVRLDVGTKSRFPPGTSRAKLEVRGHQLSAPLVVDVEVCARRDMRWFFVAFLGGAALGWFFRSLLRQRSEMRQLGLRATEVAERLEAASRRVPTKEELFVLLKKANPTRAGDAPSIEAKAINDAKQKMDDARVGWIRPEALTKAVDNADATLTKLREWRAQLCADGLTYVTAESITLADSWLLPGQLAKVDDVREALIGARDALIADDLVKADDEVFKAREKTELLVLSATGWVESVREALETARSAGWPTTARATLAAATDLSDALRQPLPDPRQLTSLAPLFRPLHDVERELRALVKRLRRAIEVAAAASEQTLRGAAPEEAAAIAQAAKLKNPTDGFDGLREVANAWRLLGDRVAKAITVAFPNPSEPGTVATALAEGDYPAAIEAARPRAVAKPEGTNEIAAVATGRAGPEPTESAVAVRPAPVPPAPWLARILLLEGSRPGSAMLVRSFRAVLWERAMQTALAALVLSIASWALYHETWVGSIHDFIVVAAGAFLSDFSVDAVTDALGKLRKA